MVCLFGLATAAERSKESLGGLRYRVEFVGDFEPRWRPTFEQVSETYRWREQRPVHTRRQLTRRMQADRDELVEVLRSFGYYAPIVEARIDDTSEVWRVVFAITVGQPYAVDRVVFENVGSGEAAAVELPAAEKFGLRPGLRLEAARVRAARPQIVDHLKSRGYPFPRVSLREVVVDHERRSGVVVFVFDPGLRATFGDLEIEGLQRVEREYVERRVPWRVGQSFRLSLVNDFRRALQTDDLFSLVRVESAGEVDEDGRLSMRARLRERRSRTLRFGAGYQTDTGPEFKAGWLHRNLRGEGERLNFDLLLSAYNATAEGGYVIPDFRGREYSLELKGGYAAERSDAYDTQSWYATSRLGRRLTPQLEVGGGIGYRLAMIDDFARRHQVGLLFFPLDLTWDSRDDILNPGQGWRLHLRMTPFVDTLNPEVFFLKTYGSAANYLELLAEPRLILANRLAAGTIGADSLLDVPKDERFFTGGGGSVRGYGYQTVGPLSEDTPTGGLSMVEFSSELRLRVTGRSGLVLFVDAGQTYPDAYPDFGEGMRWGCGVGYRFFTDFGPIRGDLAIPLNRRPGIDDRVYLYFSIGQAF